ncbi:MAG: hypothetical protein ACOYMN_18775 [Roseimicrobium sp.]
MKNRLLSLVILAASAFAGTNAMALVGGPFDNGDHSILFERGGVYQAAFSFRNGSGVAVFAQDNSFEVAAGAGTVTGMFSLRNRSMFYYKGVTYAGVAWGIVDVEARLVTGFTNGNSDYIASGTTAGSATPQQGISAARDQDIVHNGDLGATANSQFTAKITTTSPILRFRGKGSVTFMGYPELEYSRQLITELAIQSPTLPENDPSGSMSINDVAIYTSAIQGLANATLSLSAQVNNPSNYENFQETLSMRVYGSRRFL